MFDLIDLVTENVIKQNNIISKIQINNCDVFKNYFNNLNILILNI